MARASGYWVGWCVRSAALSALLFGCTSGTGGGPAGLDPAGGGSSPAAGGNGSSGSGAGASAGTAGGATVTSDIGVPPVGRLNRTQYDNTVRDLLGTALHPAADGFPADELVLGFDTIASALRVQPEHVEKYLAASDALVTELLARPATDPTHLKYFNCDVKSGAACITTVARNLASAAWRRPVTDAELAPYVAAAQAQPTLDLGLSVALRAVLTSANFLYRWELDPNPEDTAPHALNAYEVATRLSYALRGSLPDASLQLAASSGALSTPDGVLKEARRLLDASVAPLVDTFGAQWLNVNQVNTVTPDAMEYPKFDAALRAAMVAEAKAFVSEFLQGKQPVSQLFSADFAYVNARLADHYGIPGITGDALQRVSAAGTHRGGILTMGSFLTATSNPNRTSPVKRGYYVLDRLLCAAPPPPPPTVNLNIDQGSGLEKLSVRQRLAEHEKKGATCFACHQSMDAIGLGLENYDGIGTYRTADAFGPIDATSSLPGPNGPTAFNGPTELAALLAGDERMLPCVVKKVMTFSLGRDIAAPQEPLKAAIVDATKANGSTLRAALEALVVSDIFRMRRAATASEVTP
jgi:hypothetical protein